MDIANGVDIASSFSLDAGAIVNTLIGAFFGALFAFAFAAWVEKRRERKLCISAAIRAIFVLGWQASVIDNIKKQSIDPYRENPERNIYMTSFQDYTVGNVKFDVESLEFLLETKHRELLLELLVTEERFNATIQSLNSRSKLHSNKIQPLIEKAFNEHGPEATPEQIEEAIGPRLFITLDKATNELIEYVDNTFESIYVFQDKFVPALKELYPKAKFIQFEENVDSEN